MDLLFDGTDDEDDGTLRRVRGPSDLRSAKSKIVSLTVCLAACHCALERLLQRHENAVRRLKEVQRTTIDQDTSDELSSITRGSTRAINSIMEPQNDAAAMLNRRYPITARRVHLHDEGTWQELQD